MNTKKITKDLKEKYPGASIFLQPQNNPTEIICEIDPVSKHPDYSIAIAVIEKSAPHYHKITTEEYEVIKGKVKLCLGDKKQILKVGDKMTIKPGIIHWAESNSGWVKCTATPAWKQEDHVLV